MLSHLRNFVLHLVFLLSNQLGNSDENFSFLSVLPYFSVTGNFVTSPCSYCRFEWASFSPSVAAPRISLIFGCVRIPFVPSSLFKNNLEVWSAGRIGRVDSNRASFIIVNSILTVNLFNMGNKNITLIVRGSRPTMEGTHVGFFSLLFSQEVSAMWRLLKWGASFGCCL